MNNVCLIGNAGRDPDVKTFEGGKKKVSISMAVRRPSKDDKTDWFDIEIWDKAAEIAEQYLKKGHRFGIVGRLQQHTWEENGNKRSKVLVVARDLILLQPKADGSQQDQAETSNEEPSQDIFGSSSFNTTSF